jgi:hypothetical protein
VPGRSDDDDELDLSDDIVRRWDPQRLLRVLSRRAGRGQPLDEATRRRYERKLGVDLGRVRVYTGEFAEEVTRARGADAVTVGTTGMVLLGGASDRSPVTSAGRALLAHELTHVAQQSRAVHRARSFGGTPPLATEEHEAEAEEMEAAELGEEPPEEAGEPGLDDATRDAIADRVLELFEEDERVATLRQGRSRWRP